MEEEKEGKGFVIKDRRRFASGDLDQEPKAQDSGQPATEQETREQSEPQGKQQGAQGSTAERPTRESGGDRSTLPEVSFSTFVFSLSSSALVHLGEIPDPDSRQPQVDLPLAKQIIDTLGMLHDKTKGNLDEDEDRMLKNLLHDLRLRYVQKSGR